MPVNAPTITIADNGNGTGVVVTITGSTAGATNTFAHKKIISNENVVLADGSNRVGDGTISQSLANGHYLGVVRSTLGADTAYSNYVFFHSTDLGTADIAQAMASVVDRIVSLGLTGLPSGQVYKDILPFFINVDLPCIFVSLAQMSDTLTTATNERKDVGYGIRLDIVMRADYQDMDARLKRYLEWRERLMDAFHDESLPGMTKVYRVTATPQDTFLREQGELLLFVSPIILRCFVRR